MRSIKKLKSTGKAVAGSALLVGATLTGAAGLAAAQDSGSTDLGDYPSPFVDEDGEVDSTIVVGEQAKTADVVGAINVAGSLGNAAFMEEEVDVGTGATASWAAENGVTLDRDNSPIFFPQSTDTEETRFDEQDLDVLSTSNFNSEGNTEVEVEHDLRVGSQSQSFGTPGDLDDPVLFVNNPTNPTVDSPSNYLLQAEVDFDEVIDFTVQEEDDVDSSADVALEDGDEIQLFGQPFTYSSESTGDELVLYGTSDTFEVDTGSEQTVTVDGEEHTFGATYVTDDTPREATITVDGDTQNVEDGDSISVGDTEVRVTEIFRTGPDGQGRVQFSIGSQEVTIDDNEVELNDESVDGVDVTINTADADGTTFNAVEGMKFAFGAEDSDADYVEADGTYETPMFGLEFHYGGLSPNAAEDPAGTVELEAQEDSSADLSFSTNGEEADVQVAEYDSGSFQYGPDDGTIAQYEGQWVGEDDMVVLNSNEEAGLYEVNDVDNTDLVDQDTDGSVSVSLNNVVTGDSFTVEEDGVDFNDSSNTNSDGNFVIDSESVDGNDFDVEVSNSSDQASFVRSTADGDRQIWPWLYTDSGATVAMDAPGSVNLTNVFDTNSTFNGTKTLEIPSGVASNDATLSVNYSSGAPQGVSGKPSFVQYNVNFSSQSLDLNFRSADTAGVLMTQPENDDDEEEAYVLEADVQENSASADFINYTGERRESSLDDEDVDVAYDEYGAYTMHDFENSDQESFAVHLPGAQATSGMAVTGMEGSLSSEGTTSTGATSATPTGWPDAAALDSEVSGSDRNQDLILVGGPAVNTLTEELAQDNKTWTADEYDEDTWVLDLVEGFSEDTHALVVAGHSADDTRAASSFISNYADNEEDLAGETTVSMTTSASQ